MKAVADALDELQAETGIDVPIHVDGASGGFLAPFVDPDLVWDFRIHGSNRSTRPATSSALRRWAWAG